MGIDPRCVRAHWARCVYAIVDRRNLERTILIEDRVRPSETTPPLGYIPLGHSDNDVIGLIESLLRGCELLIIDRFFKIYILILLRFLDFIQIYHFLEWLLLK